MTAQALAEATGVTAANVVQGRQQGNSVSYLYEVAKACGADLTALLTGDDATS